MEPILKVKDLSVEFGDEKIIDDLNFEVKEGETFVILGPNGAGKTVLLRSLLNIIPHGGEVKWRENTKIGYVPQRIPFVKEMPVSVKDFFKLKPNGRPKKEKIEEAITWVGLPKNILEKEMGSLSSGQFQRVLIAWALIGGPQVLFFDEPTAGIDVGGEETIYTYLSKIKKERGLTVFLVTHDLNIVYKEADKVLCLNHKKVCFGLPKEVLTSQNLSELFGKEVKYYPHHQH